MSRAVIVLALFLLTTTAHADVVMGPPPTCPPGSIPSTGHMGPFCAPTECAAATDCERWAMRALQGASIECASAGLCVGTRHVFGGRGGRLDLPLTFGSCTTDADCPTGIPCAIAMRCVAPGSTPGPVSPRLLPREIARGTTAASCGALGVVGLVVLVLAASGLAIRRRAHVARERAIRALVEARGRVPGSELHALAGSAADVAHALAPLARRVRVEIDDDGEAIYALEDEDEDEARERQA